MLLMMQNKKLCTCLVQGSGSPMLWLTNFVEILKKLVLCNKVNTHIVHGKSEKFLQTELLDLELYAYFFASKAVLWRRLGSSELNAYSSSLA